MQDSRHKRLIYVLQALSLGLLLLISLPAFSQNGEISGRLQRNGSPLDFVVIKLQDTEGCTLNAQMTDEYGAFEFKHLEPGVYSLTGEYQSFPIRAKVTLGVDAHVMISLTPSIFRWVPAADQPKPNPNPTIITHKSCCFQPVYDRESPLDRLPIWNGWVHNEMPKIGGYDNQKPIRIRQEPLGTITMTGGTKLWGAMQPMPAMYGEVKVMHSGIPAEYGDAVLAVVIWRDEPMRWTVGRH